MSDTRIVRINVRDGYDVMIGSGLIKDAGSLAKNVIKPCRIAVITDSIVEQLYLESVKMSFKNAGFDVVSFSFPAGEESKNMATLSDILEFLAENDITRSDCLVALGGGVVGDITGFAAGVFLRGIKFIQIPTTLLAAVDSSVGGKTAVDLKSGKNLAGVFLQPKLVLCDTDTMSTLPEDILSCGVAEAIKTGVLFDIELFEIFERDGVNTENLPLIIERCVMHKGRVVEADEFDRGERQLLNLGHTVGHAIEKCSSYSILHGHAVAMGMAMIARASERLSLCDEPMAKRIEAALIKNGLQINAPFSSEELSSAALSDKKRKGIDISFVIPKKIGECYLKKVNISEIPRVFASGMEEK